MARSVRSRVAMKEATPSTRPSVFAALLRERLAEALVLADDLSLRELDRLAGHAVSLAAGLLSKAKPHPSLSVAVAWADVLGVSLDWLTGRLDTPPSMEHVRASVLEARKRYATAHPPRGRKGAGRRVLALLAKRETSKTA